MKKLAIDTSNQTLAVAITEDDRLLGQIQTTVNKNHSTTLMPAIDFLMNSLQLKPTDLNQIVVAKGPGSYTGLRIGVTTAKTLANTLNISLVAVSSLKVLAANCLDKNVCIVPVFDARRDNVYAGVYRWDDKQLISVFPDKHQSFTELMNQLKQFDAIQFIGEDMKKFAHTVSEHLPKAKLPNVESQNYPSALTLAELASYSNEVDSFSFVPNYLKRVEAEEKWLETHVSSEGNYVEKV